MLAMMSGRQRSVFLNWPISFKQCRIVTFPYISYKPSLIIDTEGVNTMWRSTEIIDRHFLHLCIFVSHIHSGGWEDKKLPTNTYAPSFLYLSNKAHKKFSHCQRWVWPGSRHGIRWMVSLQQCTQCHQRKWSGVPQPGLEPHCCWPACP